MHHPKYNSLFLCLLSTFLFIISHKLPQTQASRNNDFATRVTGITRVLEAKDEETKLVLAAERTRRRDPLDDFKYYHGGWNISEAHYFSSVGFSGGPLFIIAATWFVGFGIVALICHWCCQNHSFNSSMAYWVSLIYIFLFTLTAIVGCVVLYVGQGRFHSETTNTLNYIVRQADDVVDTLNNVTRHAEAARTVGIDRIALPRNAQREIGNLEMKLNASSATLERATRGNSDDIQRVFDTVRYTLIIVSAVMLVLACLGFLCSIMGKLRLVYALVVIGWILVTCTFILGGTFLLLHNVVGDTCVAMNEWVKNPRAESALDDILPCVDSATAAEALRETKNVTSELVNVVNTFIANVSNAEGVPPQAPIYYNQSGPPVPILCDPFRSDPAKTAHQCAVGELSFNNAPKEWKRYVCQVSKSGTCTTLGRLTPQYYEQLTSISNVAAALYDYGPFLSQLVDCTFVRSTFKNISDDRCPGLRQNSRLIFIGLALVSASVMFSLVFWVFFAGERRQSPEYTKQVDVSA